MTCDHKKNLPFLPRWPPAINTRTTPPSSNLLQVQRFCVDYEVHRPQKICRDRFEPSFCFTKKNTPLLLGAGRRHDHTRHPQHPPHHLSSITVATSRSRCSSHCSSRRTRFPPVPAASPQAREGGGTSKAHNTALEIRDFTG